MISIVNTECHVPKTFSDLAKIAAWGRLGRLKASPQKRSPKFATRAQKQKQMEDNEIVDAEWTEVHGIENRGQ